MSGFSIILRMLGLGAANATTGPRLTIKNSVNPATVANAEKG
jgi:hypothetical protein